MDYVKTVSGLELACRSCLVTSLLHYGDNINKGKDCHAHPQPRVQVPHQDRMYLHAQDQPVLLKNFGFLKLLPFSPTPCSFVYKLVR